MIAFVSGTVAALAPDAAVVEVGGVGMAVQCTPNTLSTLRLGKPAKLALTACMRKLLTILNAIVRTQTPCRLTQPA